MSVYRISYRYANSLMQLAEEKKLFDKISTDAELVFNTLKDSKELRSVLKNPVIKLVDKKSLLEKIFDKKITTHTQNFISFIVEKNREEILFDIFREFLVLVDRKNGVIKAQITTAMNLQDTQKNKIVSELESMTGKKVSANYSIDNNVIGGFVIKIDDTVYDASIQHQLNLLRKKFSEEVSIN